MNKELLSRDKPKGVMRWFLRVPIWLYRMRLGWMMSNRFIMLHHTGRKTGKTRYAVVEVVHFDRENNIYTIASGWGKKSDWYQNIIKKPDIVVSTYKGIKKANALVLPAGAGEDALRDYARRNPTAYRMLMKTILGSESADAVEVSKAARMLPMMEIHIISNGILE